MGRNSGPGLRALRIGVALASWLVAGSAVQGLFGAEVASAARQLELRIEQRFDDPAPPAPDAQPARSHDADSIEPWELVRA
jgi:hypothetical protein